MDIHLSNLLRAVVDEYVATGEPVGSQSLVERYRLEVSPATVRNWFAELDEEGYLSQPHTSGGRLPTEKGFLTYVELFVTPKPARKREREQMEHAVDGSGEQRFRQLAKTIAALSGLTVVVGFGDTQTFYTGLSQLCVQPEFRNWQRVASLMEVLDRLDETLLDLRRRSYDEPQILIGRACPFGAACGIVVGSFDDGMIGILGPLRMDYQHAFSLMGVVHDIFS